MTANEISVNWGLIYHQEAWAKFNLKDCGPHLLFIKPRRYAQVTEPRTTKHGLHDIWDQRNNLGRHWHDGCVGCAQEPLCALLLSGLQEIQDKIISCVLATPRPQRKQMTSISAMKCDVTLTNFKTVVQTLTSWHYGFPSHSIDLGPQLDLIRNIK